MATEVFNYLADCGGQAVKTGEDVCDFKGYASPRVSRGSLQSQQCAVASFTLGDHARKVGGGSRAYCGVWVVHEDQQHPGVLVASQTPSDARSRPSAVLVPAEQRHKGVRVRNGVLGTEVGDDLSCHTGGVHAFTKQAQVG